MAIAPPELPAEAPRHFRTTVHGTVFAGREAHLARIQEGDALTLRAEPLPEAPPEVWVHLPTGEPIGHLPPEISAWLGPWMLRGGAVRARAAQVAGSDTPSWRRLLLEVLCA